MLQVACKGSPLLEGTVKRSVKTLKSRVQPAVLGPNKALLLIHRTKGLAICPDVTR